jgi:hypothetical protein
VERAHAPAPPAIFDVRLVGVLKHDGEIVINPKRIEVQRSA